MEQVHIFLVIVINLCCETFVGRLFVIIVSVYYVVKRGILLNRYQLTINIYERFKQFKIDF